ALIALGCCSASAWRPRRFIKTSAIGADQIRTGNQPQDRQGADRRGYDHHRTPWPASSRPRAADPDDPAAALEVRFIDRFFDITDAKDWNCLRSCDRLTTVALERDADYRSARALWLWNQSRDPRGTVISSYLASRGVTLPASIARDVIS